MSFFLSWREISKTPQDTFPSFTLLLSISYFVPRSFTHGQKRTVFCYGYIIWKPPPKIDFFSKFFHILLILREFPTITAPRSPCCLGLHCLRRFPIFQGKPEPLFSVTLRLPFADSWKLLLVFKQNFSLWLKIETIWQSQMLVCFLQPSRTVWAVLSPLKNKENTTTLF